VNPVVFCAKHATPFHKVSEEMDEDGTQVMLKQYWAADCGCQIEITMAVPNQQAN
jgi:hypothetical protein